MKFLKESSDYPSKEFDKAIKKAKQKRLTIPDIDELYDLLYDNYSERGDDFKDFLRYKVKADEIFSTIEELSY